MSQIIAFLSGRGGTGKSVIAASLACELVNKNQHVLLVDLALGNRCLDQLLGLADQIVYDITDISDGRMKSRKVILSPGDESPDLLPASQTRGCDTLDSDRMEALFHQLCGSYDFILVDTPCDDEAAAALSARISDRVILVETPDASGVRGLDRIRVRVSEHRPELVPEILLNRYMPGGIAGGWQSSPAEISELTGLSILGWVAFDPELYKAAASAALIEGGKTQAFEQMERIANIMMGGKSVQSDPSTWTEESSRGLFSRLFRHNI